MMQFDNVLGICGSIGVTLGPNKAGGVMDQLVGSNRISSYILFAVVALAPLPFGSANEFSIAVRCVLLGVAASGDDATLA